MKKDYIIVGGGLAGLSFAHYCLKNNKSFILIDSTEQAKSSLVAVGLFNPVVLKRFTAIWNAAYQTQLADNFYRNMENMLEEKFIHYIPLHRKFANIEEQNNWFSACDKPDLQMYLTDSIIHDKVKGVDSPLGFGEVHHSGYVNTKKFVKSFHKYLQDLNKITYEYFNYTLVEVSNKHIKYKNLKAKKIIFAEGFSMLKNPYFNQLPLDGTKGEVLTVRIPDLSTNVILKTNIFVLPVGNNLFRVGATYDWQDKTNEPTANGKKQLMNDLEKMINLPYEVVAHQAGVRPTVRDRMPLVGRHYQHQNIYLLNGLGTRGVLLGPYLAEQLFYHIENQTNLPKEIDIKRYYKKLNLQ